MALTKEKKRDNFNRARNTVRKLEKSERKPAAKGKSNVQKEIEKVSDELGALDWGNIGTDAVQIQETLNQHEKHFDEHDRKHKAADKKMATLMTLVSVFGSILLAVVAFLLYDRADSLKSLLSCFFKYM